MKGGRAREDPSTPPPLLLLLVPELLPVVDLLQARVLLLEGRQVRSGRSQAPTPLTHTPSLDPSLTKAMWTRPSPACLCAEVEKTGAYGASQAKS